MSRYTGPSWKQARLMAFPLKFLGARWHVVTTYQDTGLGNNRSKLSGYGLRKMKINFVHLRCG